MFKKTSFVLGCHEFWFFLFCDWGVCFFFAGCAVYSRVLFNKIKKGLVGF